MDFTRIDFLEVPNHPSGGRLLLFHQERWGKVNGRLAFGLGFQKPTLDELIDLLLVLLLVRRRNRPTQASYPLPTVLILELQITLHDLATTAGIGQWPKDG